MSKPIQPTLGKRIQEARLKAKLSQTDAAARAKITNIYLCQIEHGDGMPSLTVLARLADAFKTTLSKLFK